ncbi:MAG TPA: DinB family protein [Actinomycetota bacterium]|jgi:hypothetical protein
MTDPSLEAARQILAEELDAMRQALDGITVEALRWRPAGDDTNPIDVLVVHAMHSTRWWLSAATGAEMPERDRPSEFLTEATDADELRSLFEEFAAECQGLLETAPAFDAGAERTASLTSRGGRSRSSDKVTAAWALLHALEHLREHVAHASLTRQLWEARPR